MILTPGKFWGLRRLAAPDGTFRMLAVDQRPPLKKLVADAKSSARSKPAALGVIKAELLVALAPHASASLADPAHGLAPALHAVPPSTGLIATLEDSDFRTVKNARLSAPIKGWSVQQARSCGADAIKALAWYHPDAPAAVRAKQQAFVRKIGSECRRLDIPFVFELLLYPLQDKAKTASSKPDPEVRAANVAASVRAFADEEYGVDMFKLESPWPLSSLPDPASRSKVAVACRRAFAELDRAAGRPWVLLSAGTSRSIFGSALRFAYGAGASGFLAGRTIWWDSARAWPDIKLMRKRLAKRAVPYFKRISKLTAEKATPWHTHRSVRASDLIPQQADLRKNPAAK